MRQILSELEQLRRRTHLMLLVQRAAVVLAWVLGIALALVLVDYVLRLPSGVRLVLLTAALAALAEAARRYVLPALRYHPSLTQLALRVERALPALDGRLASSVEFAMAGVDEVNPLAGRSVREAQRRLAGDSVRRIVRPSRTMRDITIAMLVCVVVALLGLTNTTLAATGFSRLLLPYGNAQWPARTAVASLMDEVVPGGRVHPRGQVLALRARNLTSGDEDARVDVTYRLIRDGAAEPWQTVVLTHQGSGVHERLVDTNAERVELYFATEDARTDVEPVHLEAPPSVMRAELSVQPPEYAKSRVPEIAANLGPGLDERAVTERPGLAGSAVHLVLEMNKTLPAPADADAWVRSTFGLEASSGGLPVLETSAQGDDGPSRWTLTWSLDSTATLDVELVDEHGLHNAEPIAYRIEVLEDLPPSATITTPEGDQAVLPSAMIPIVGEATDDVGIARIALEAEARRGGSEGGELLPFAPQQDSTATTATIEADLDLAEFDLAEGDVILVTALADDIFAIGDDRHDTVRSPVRRLVIMSELDFVAQLRRQLSAVRQNAIRVESMQSELQDDIEESGVQPGQRRAQAELGNRIAQQREIIDDLERQMSQNRLDDEPLENLFEQSRDLLDHAGRAANKAVDSIDKANPGDRAADEEGNEEGEGQEASTHNAADDEEQAIADAQQEVRDELVDLIELLDRDEDTWIVQRQLEGLLEQQREIQSDTGELADQTIGQSLSDLSDRELSELERIAQRQRELRDEVRRLIEEMRRRAQAMDEVDPQSASGMRSAADTGEAREVDRDMETAAQRAQQNQLQSASAAQQAAQDSLERMLGDLEETKQARAEELLRQLASLIESIDRLILVQENELIALAGAVDGGDFGGRDRAMIRLNQNTESVASMARAAGPPARRIARTLDRAADAQGAAITALRSTPIDADAAREAEDRSLELLKEAKELAEALEEETEEDRVAQEREKLIDAYRKFAEMQSTLRADTLVLAEVDELNRRQLVDARRQGNVQQQIRTGLSDLEANTSEVLDSAVFSYVHRRLDRWCGIVSDALWEGIADVDVTDRQYMIAEAIGQQIEALEEALAPPDEFAEEEQGDGGGGGGQGPMPLIPPAAEVKRLHGLQTQVYDQTRGIDSREDLSAAQRRQRVRELGEMQRDLVSLGEKMLEELAPPQQPQAPGVPDVTPPEGEPETNDEPPADSPPPSDGD